MKDISTKVRLYLSIQDKKLADFTQRVEDTDVGGMYYTDGVVAAGTTGVVLCNTEDGQNFVWIHKDYLMSR